VFGGREGVERQQRLPAVRPAGKLCSCWRQESKHVGNGSGHQILSSVCGWCDPQRGDPLGHSPTISSSATDRRAHRQPLEASRPPAERPSGRHGQPKPQSRLQAHGQHVQPKTHNRLRLAASVRSPKPTGTFRRIASPTATRINLGATTHRWTQVPDARTVCCRTSGSDTARKVRSHEMPLRCGSVSGGSSEWRVAPAGAAGVWGAGRAGQGGGFTRVRRSVAALGLARCIPPGTPRPLHRLP
jgi:hypothetical protein